MLLSAYIGSRSRPRIMTVDAHAESVDFYLKSNFQFFSDADKDSDTRVMYFDLARFKIQLGEEK